MNGIDPDQLEQLKQLEILKKKVLGQILTKEALERLNRVRLVKPELAEQVELYLIQIYQSGKLERVTDEKLKSVLQILSEKKDFKIKRK